MRKIPILFAAILAIFTLLNPVSTLKAQGAVELSGWGGYMLPGRVDFYEGRFVMHDNATYGGHIGFEISKNNFTVISYSNTVTTADFVPYGNAYNPWTGDVGINYIQIGGVHNFELGGPVEPFAGMSMGTTILNIRESNISDVWRFSLALKGGLDIMLTDKVGIILQTRMMLPMYFEGFGFFVGIGSGGTSSGLSMRVVPLVLQFDFTGGLVMRFSK